MITKEMQVYEIIEKKAGSNALMQGISGTLGFPFTAAVDVAVIFTHYGAMMNEIRAVYGRSKMDTSAAAPVLKSITTELFGDIVIDKVIGNLPLIGIPANIIAAKAMTWRLGILFGIMAAKGEYIDEDVIRKAITAIRAMFPYQKSLLAQKPSMTTVDKLLRMSENTSDMLLERKLDTILDSLI